MPIKVSLIHILIILFTLLIGYQVYLAWFPKKLIEGLEDNTTSTNNDDTPGYNVSEPNNSVNISDSNTSNTTSNTSNTSTEMSNDVKKKFNDIQLEIDAMQTQIDSILQQQADYAQELAGPAPVDVTGTDEETVENVESSINGNPPK